MRIIAGEFKGRRLVSFKADHIRPTTDRVKETIFNKIFDLENKKVLDLFAGTGNLAIESLSRGAASVISVEKHPKSVQIIKQNSKAFGLESRLNILRQDVFTYLKRSKDGPFDIILVDPPFTEKLAHSVMLALVGTKAAGEDTLIVVESSAQEQIDDEYGSFKLLDRKSFGDKLVSFFTR